MFDETRFAHRHSVVYSDGEMMRFDAAVEKSLSSNFNLAQCRALAKTGGGQLHLVFRCAGFGPNEVAFGVFTIDF